MWTACLVGVLAVSAVGGRGCGTTELRHRDPVAPAGLRQLERDAFNQVNAERQKQGLAKLAWNEPLAAAARQHSERMARLGFFSHVDPEYGNPMERVSRAGIRWTRVEENIFQEQGYGDPAGTAAKSWMNSPGHRANILDGRVTQSGLGIAVAANGTYYFTQLFIRP